MNVLKIVYSFPILTILIASLIISPMYVELVFAEDESEKKRLEKEREQEKKERERIDEERKKAEEQAREDRKQYKEDLKESLKIEFDDDLGSGNIADWVLIGTVVLIVGVVGNTGYKILKPKKRKIVPTK